MMGAILIILTFYFADISLLPMLFKIIQFFLGSCGLLFSISSCITFKISTNQNRSLFYHTAINKAQVRVFT